MGGKTGQTPVFRPIDAAVIMLAALGVVSLQFFRPGYYYLANDDAAMLSKYVPQFIESFRQGVFYPRWMADDFGGYGSPAFVFYSPLLYVLCSLLVMAGLDLTTASTVISFLGLSAGGVFVYLLLKRRAGINAALIAALAYILLPTRVLNLYFINSPAGRFSAAWLPAVLYYTDRLIEVPFRRRYLAGLASSYALLILSHVATAFIFTPFVMAYGLFLSRVYKRPAAAFMTATGLVAGMCLSSFYFMSVLFEQPYIRIGLIYRFEYGKNFLPFFLHLYDNRAGGNPQMMYMIAGVIIIELCMALFLYFKVRRDQGPFLGRWGTFHMLAALACIFMMSSLSAPLWKYLPGLKTVAYPVRFAAVYLVFISAFTGICASKLIGTERKRHRSTAVFTVIVLALLLLDGRFIAGATPYSKSEALSQARKDFFLEYLPASAVINAPGTKEQSAPLLSSDKAFTVEISDWGQEYRAFAIGSSEGVPLSVRTYYFPGWKAWVDGSDIPIGVDDKTGAMLLDIPAGRHNIVLRFTNTWPRTAGWIISLVTLVLLVFPYKLIWLRKEQAR